MLSLALGSKEHSYSRMDGRRRIAVDKNDGSNDDDC